MRAYPLICFPFAEIGVLDAALLTLYTNGGPSDEATVFAALVVWRLGTVLLPLLLGVWTLWHWRRANPAEAELALGDGRDGDDQDDKYLADGPSPRVLPR